MKVKDKRVKDKFYKLAKETGYRSRASFKLIQLNRKFEFLQKSRVVIDLCAAPGGWLQVAQKSMPVSSLIIGVDLVPIKSIPNVICLQEDITTERCRQSLKNELKTWKADTVLHDGAPNVGKSWLHDAFAQNRLTLSALKLASEMLVKGGWFITKVFRSKDYNALLWVFRKLFKKVHVTKPQASRNESAEIYVICQSYISPDKIDPKFLDPSFLFEDVQSKSETIGNILNINKTKKKAEGYDDDITLFQHLKASDFIFCSNHLERLSRCTEIVFDDEDISAHKLTTKEIKECCRDIKVLGSSDLRSLLNWRKKLRAVIKDKEQSEKRSNISDLQEVLDVEAQEINDAVAEANDIQTRNAQVLKKKKKKMLKEKRKIHERINLKMIIRDDEPIIQEDVELFKFSSVKNKKDLDVWDDAGTELSIDSQFLQQDNEIHNRKRKPRAIYDRNEDWNHDNIDDETEDEKPQLDGDEAYCDAGTSLDLLYEEEEEKNPLVVDLIDKNIHLNDTVSKWFDKEDFNELNDENEIEMELLSENLKKSDPNEKVIKIEEVIENTKSKDTTDLSPVLTDLKKKKKKKKIILGPEELALGTLMIQSKKMKRDLVDNAYNRYSSLDVCLPDWFVKDEEKHYRKLIPVTAEMVSEYRDQLKEINARPIKKVVEAKARKKKKALKRLERARKKAESITESLDMSEKEKVSQLKAVYKKAQGKRDNNVTYVVAKKAHGGKVKRPHGVRGRYKVVDKRMRKDDRKMKAERKKHPKRYKSNPQKKNKK